MNQLRSEIEHDRRIYFITVHRLFLAFEKLG